MTKKPPAKPSKKAKPGPRAERLVIADPEAALAKLLKTKPVK